MTIGPSHRRHGPTVSTARGASVHPAPRADQALLDEGPDRPHRVWAHFLASLADEKTIRTAFGGTVNDVVLAAVAGGTARCC